MRKQKIEMIPPGRTLPVPETLSGEDMILTSIRFFLNLDICNNALELFVFECVANLRFP